jgi:hypothetical protein
MDQAIVFRVRGRAYHIWDAETNWLQAETEVLQVIAPKDAQGSSGRGE